MELLAIIDALKRASARRITAVMPYYGYARQDRKNKPRVPITARLLADLLTEVGTNRVLTMDLHAGQIQGFFSIPVDNLYASPILLPHLREQFRNELVIVAPDAGGVPRARAYASRLNAGLALIDKRRADANQAEAMHLIGEVKEKTAIILDDMVDTAGTLVEAARTLLENGARAVHACQPKSTLIGATVRRGHQEYSQRRFHQPTIRNTALTASRQSQWSVVRCGSLRSPHRAKRRAHSVLLSSNHPLSTMIYALCAFLQRTTDYGQLTIRRVRRITGSEEIS
jgi:ribose-phosphate pyrophosphokinase